MQPGRGRCWPSTAPPWQSLDDFAEPAQIQARLWFWYHAGITPVAWDEPGFGLPPCSIAGGWWQRWSLGRQLAKIRDLAQDAGGAVSGHAFRKLQLKLKLLSQWAEAGVIAWPRPVQAPG